MANWIWMSVGVGVCPGCAARHGEERPLEAWEAAGLPGEGATYCGPHCACILFRTDRLESIAERMGVSFTDTASLISGLGFQSPITVMTQPQQIDLINLGLDEISEMGYDEAREELIDIIRASESIPNLDLLPLPDLISIMETL